MSKKKFKGYVPYKSPDPHQLIQEINRGVGSPQPKKGRGSYRRKNRNNKEGDDYDKDKYKELTRFRKDPSAWIEFVTGVKLPLWKKIYINYKLRKF